MDPKAKLSRSMEDYLEAILVLGERNRTARVKDIAAELGVQMPSVTGALRNLRDLGFVDYQKNVHIRLTAKGTRAAKSVKEKHRILTAFLEDVLLIPRDRAEEQACRMEHSIDGETVMRLERLTSAILERNHGPFAGSRDERLAILDGDVQDDGSRAGQ